MVNPLTNQRVLVTGGAGFIGSNLCEALLAANNEVICFDNFLTGKRDNIDPFSSNDKFTLIEGDIRDFEACLKVTSKVDVVMHQAALGSVPRSINDPITSNSINVSGFLNVLKASVDNKVKRFVYAASSSTYGDHTALPKVEDRIGKPLSPYAVSKLVNELYAQVFSDLYGIETIGLRYFNVFGPKQDPEGAYAAAIPSFIKALMSYKSPIIHGDGSQTRDFTFIQNVIQANFLAATINNPKAINTVYNVAFGESTNLLELVGQLKHLLSEFDSKIASVQILHGPERVGDVKHSLADISKAKQLLNYHPEHDFASGIKLAIDWYWNNYR